MISVILVVPIILILSVFQTVAISRINILSGSADIILLALVSWTVSARERNVIIWALIGGFFISILSAMPAPAVFLVYLSTAGIAWMVYRILWQSPILAILLSILLSTITKFIIELSALQFSGIQFSIISGVSNILFPSLVLNFFFLFPVYFIVGDVAKWISPKEELDA